MMKKSVEDLKSYWDQKIEKSKGSWECVLWESLPTWNKYIDKPQIHHLKRIFNMVKPSDIGWDVKATSIRSSVLKRLARRPVFSALGNKKLDDIGLKMRDWGVALRDYPAEKGRMAGENKE